MALTDTTVAKTALRENSPIQRLTPIFISSQSLLFRYNGYLNYIDSFQDLLLHRQYGMSVVVGRAWCIVNVGAQYSTELVFIYEFACSNLGLSFSGISACS